MSACSKRVKRLRSLRSSASAAFADLNAGSRKSVPARFGDSLSELALESVWADVDPARPREEADLGAELRRIGQRQRRSLRIPER